MDEQLQHKRFRWLRFLCDLVFALAKHSILGITGLVKGVRAVLFHQQRQQQKELQSDALPLAAASHPPPPVSWQDMRSRGANGATVAVAAAAYAAGARAAYRQRYEADLVRVQKLVPPDARWLDAHCHLESILHRTGKVGTKPLAFNNEEPTDLVGLVASWPANLDGCICNIVFQRAGGPWGRLSEWDWLHETLPLMQPGTPLGDKIWFTVGIHPSNADFWSRDVEQQIRSYSRHPRCVGVGECGLDFSFKSFRQYSDEVSPEQQLHAFRAQASLAVEVGKALVIHSRQAEHLLFQVLCEKVPPTHPVHVHCYTDSLEQALHLCEAWDNLKIGFTGCITFGANDGQGGSFRRVSQDKPEHFEELLHHIPLSRLLIETDGPYMCPEPFRGQSSHPGHVHRVAEHIARVKGVALAEVMSVTRQNSRDVYGV